ncbi:MAG: OmpA family protein [Chitinophagaceae bacterium]|nr:OmpA family protein [Chitinophagaceae bacterium]
MKNKLLFLTLAATMFFASCVSRKKLDEAQAKYLTLNASHTLLKGDLKDCEDTVALLRKSKALAETDNSYLKNKIADLNKQIDYLKENSSTVLNQLKDLSVVTSSQAESIKKSLENIGAKDNYIRTLQSSIAQKDSLNLALVMNLKGALADVNDKDIEVKVEKGVVYISISDKLLFKTGSYDITPAAMTVLGKVATVLNNQPNIEFLVEGHTDSLPISRGDIKDNWDLSVLRATSVVRLLQTKYNLDPKRMTAGGRGEYVPVSSNNTAEGRATNRRTRIVILPQLDQFFQLLEKK